MDCFLHGEAADISNMQTDKLTEKEFNEDMHIQVRGDRNLGSYLSGAR